MIKKKKNKRRSILLPEAYLLAMEPRKSTDRVRVEFIPKKTKRHFPIIREIYKDEHKLRN